MSLSTYFESVKGFGVLATVDAGGQVNQAIYAKPCFFDKSDETICSFVMANRLSHDNVAKNPSAAYLFVEAEAGFAGKRLRLTAIGEETDPERIEIARALSRPPLIKAESNFVVHFRIDAVRPLIGNG